MKSLPIVLLVVATALAVPLPVDRDAWPPVEELACTNSRFKVNNIYHYKYEAFSLTNVDGTSEKGSGLRYRCDVTAAVPEPCKLVVSVDKCALRHLDDIEEQTKLPRHDSSKEFDAAISQYDIIAHVDNGVVSKVLAHPEEQRNILNIKRGILNMMSLNFVDGEEEIVEGVFPCVSGNCSQLRRVVTQRDGYETEVEVAKDLRKCENKPISGLWTSPYIYNVTLYDKLITSNLTCNFELEWDAIKRAKCAEFHTFWPFSYDSTRGIKMEIFQDLKFSDKEKVNSVTPVNEESRRVTDIIFEQETEEEMKVNDPTYATEILKKLVKGSLDEIQMETPQLFSQFVGAMRKLNNESIHELYERAINCPLYYESCQNNEVKVNMIKTFVYDALVQCGTLECFRVINTAIISGEVSKPLADFVMYTMAIRDYPELTLIDETLRVAFYNRTQSTLLPLSIMINNYWNRNEEALRSERRLPEEIEKAIAFLSSIIGHDCSMPSNAIDGGETVEHQRQVFLALKAIGNIGQPALRYDNSFYNIDDMISTRLIKCAENKDIPRNISLAAVQAMRRFEIQQDLRDPLKRILLRTNEDVELRMVSYLMIMRSRPHEVDIADVLHMLRDEPIDQVRAFVYSHLDNILESDLESTRELRNTILTALRGEDLPEYPKDIRRLSRNIELSKVLNISQFDGIIRYLNETFDSALFEKTFGQLLKVNKTIGGGIEMNTMHNVETYWLRAAMMKTTLNLLGKEWEMVEAGIDMQGFEPTLEAIFGPQGFFPDNILMSIIKTIDEKIIQVIRELYNNVEPHVVEVANTPYEEMPDVLSDKAKATTDYMYDTYNKMYTKQKRSVTDSLVERITELTNLLPGNIHENIQNIHETVSKLPLDPAASMYLRLLGHEVGFVTLDDMVRMVPKVNLTKDGLMQMAMKMIQKAQNGMEFNITKSFVFMEKEFVLPTTIGLPVRCNLNGTTSVSLRLRGKAGLQLPKVFVAGRIAPSGSVNMIGSMTTELPGFTKHAVIANATVYHASRFEGNVTIDGTHIKVNLNNTSPMNLFNSSTNFYLMDLNGELTYLPGVQQDRVEKELCVPEKLTQPIFGMTPCVSWAYPNASYAEMAPRFPLTGPSSFNVTLRNIDPELRTFTWEAMYKQIKPTTSKNTMMRRRRSTSEPKANIIDTVVLKFSAPGKDLKREISSVAQFDRSKTEFRYNFSVPEVNMTFFSGILNKTCSKSKTSGFQFVSNFTALRPEYNGSISLSLMNSTITDKSNYTAVYNMSIMKLYSSAVAEYVQTPSFLIASTNVTYYWDNETPVYRQLMWPFNNYTINPTKYRSDYIMLKSEKRMTRKIVERDSILKVSVMNQNFTVKSDIVKDDVYYSNDIMIDFENSYKNLRIINITAKSEKRPTKQSIKIAAERFGHGVFVQWDGKQDNTDSNHTLTYGYEGNRKEILESFKVFQNQPSVMAWFEDEAYTIEHISYNITHTLCLRDESIRDEKYQRLVYFNTTFPKPLTSERLNFSLSARVANESMKPSNNRSYWMEFNTSVPFLWFHNAQRVQFVDGKDGIELRYNNTMTELYSNRQISFDDRFVYQWKTLNATMEFNIKSCYFNYTFNTTMYNSTESGYVFDYSSVMNNTLLHLFNVTHGGNFSVAPRNISLIGGFWHPWMQVNMTNVLHKHGPITRFSLANIRAMSVDIKNKAQMWDYTGIKNVARELLYNTLDSSFNLTNLITVRTPWLGNVTFDHVTNFNFSVIDHAMSFEVVRPRSNVGFVFNTSALVNSTLLRGSYMGNLTGNRFYNGSSSMGFALRRADKRALAFDFENNHGFVTPLGNMSMNGTYRVHNMSRPWRFDVINGTMGYDVNTRLVNSTLNSSFILDDFTHIFKFNGIRADLDHNITSRWIKWIANGSFIVDDFRNPVNYGRINGSLITDFKSFIVNMTHSASMDVQDMTGAFRFEKVGGNITQNIDSIFGKSVFTTGVDLKEVSRPWNFDMVNGSINYNLTSRFANLTMTNLLKFENFRKLWEFGKINGTMVWNLNTSLANATLKHGVDFDNFVTPINFNRVNVTLEHEINSRLANASLKQAYGMYGMRSYLTYDRANSSIRGEIRTPWINSSLEHVMDVRDMQGPFNMRFANISLAARTDNRWLNFTTVNGMEWNNMVGIFTFDRINSNHNFNISTPIGILNTFGELDLNDFTNLTMFRKVNATTLVNVKSRMLNYTTRIGHEMHNFRSLFDFDRVQTDERTTVRNCLMNHTGETHLIFDTFRSIFDFNSINGNMDARTRTFLGEHNQTYTFDLRNSRKLFNFDRLFASAQVDTKARWFNMTATHNVDLVSFDKIYSFRRASMFSNIDIKTPLINTTHELRAEDDDHREWFFFNRIFGGHRWTVDTPVHSYVTDSNIELLHFYRLTEFTHVHANNEMELVSRLANFTSNHKLHLDGFRQAFNFDKVSTGGTTELSTILGNHRSNIDISFNRFRSFLDFDSIMNLVESHFESRYLNDSMILRSDVTNHRNLFDFDAFTGSYNMLFHTRWYNLTQDAGFGFHNFRKIFNFDRVSTGASYNVSTPILSTGSRAGIEFNNFRSILNYERINASAAMNLTSRWLNVTTEATHGIHEMRKMFVFERMNTTGVLNISTPIIRSNTSLGLDMYDFVKLWQFTRVNGSALMNVDSRWLNITNEGMFGLHKVITPWNFERINSSAKMNVRTPIINTNGSVGVELNDFTNLVNFRRVNGSGNWNVISRCTRYNMSTAGEFGLHNFRKIFTFERINGSARMNVGTPLFTESSEAGIEFNNFRNLTSFDRVNATGNMKFLSRCTLYNMTSTAEFGLHNMRNIFNFERINGSARMDVGTPLFTQKMDAGVEFNDFEKLWAFRRINGSANYNIISRCQQYNMSTNGEFGLDNFEWFTTFERMNGGYRMSLGTPFFRQASRAGVEFNDFATIFNFRRINATANMTVDSRFLNVTSEGGIEFNNFRQLFNFDLINSSSTVNVSTPLARASLVTGHEYRNFRSLFDYDLVNYNHTVGIRSKLANFTCEGGIAVHDLASFSVYRLIDGYERMNLTSKYLNLTSIHRMEDRDHTAFFNFKRFNISSVSTMITPWSHMKSNTTFDVQNMRNVLDFDRADINMTTESVNRLMNMTTNSSIALRGFRSLFNFDKVNTTFLVDVKTPIATSRVNASLLLDTVTSWRLHRGINGSIVFLFNSSMLNSSVITQMNMTDFTTFAQMIEVSNRVRVMEREAGLVLTEKINNDFVLFNATVPETGSLCALAELNKIGDVLNMSLFRQTRENANITDLSWILMLNRSDVVYSNFTWNPETLRAIRLFSEDGVNHTIEYALIALNKTREMVNMTMTMTRRAINNTIQAVNYTYNNPIDSLKIVVNGSLVDATIIRMDTARLFVNQTLNSTIFYVNQTWNLMDFTSMNSTMESFMEAIKKTPVNVPMQFVNSTLRRMDFSTLNSTITSVLREMNCPWTNKTVITLIKHLNNSIEIIGTKMNQTLVFLNTTSTKAIIYFNQKLNETLGFLNETWRDGNFTSLNATIDTIVSALNRTRLNTTILFVNQTWKQMNFTSLNSTIESLKKVVNLTAINATVQGLIERVNFTQINETVFEMLRMVNLTHLNETVRNYTNLIMTEAHRIAMNESHPINQFTIKYLNTTAWNLTMKLHPIVVNYTTKYYPVVRNFTLHYYKMGQNLTDKYYPVVYNFTVTYYPHVVNYTLVALNKTKNYTAIAMNLTRCYGEVLYNRSLVVFNRTANYTDRALNMTMHYGVVAFNKTRNYTLWLVNITRPHRELAYNFTLNMTNLALNKAVNYSLRAIEYTANKTEWAKEHHREYIIYYIEVLNNATGKSSNITARVLNVTETYARKAINITVTYATPWAKLALARSKDPDCMINILPMKYYQKTLYVLGTELKEKSLAKALKIKDDVVRKALEIVLKEDSTLNVYLEKTTDMNAVEFGMFVRAKALEYKNYLQANATYFANVTRSNVTFWTNYTLENAPMVALNLIGNATVQANRTVLWLNSTRSQSLNATLEQVKVYLNETAIEVIDFLNKTLNGSTERLLNMTWVGYNMTIQYANRTLIFVNETAIYLRNTTIKVWRFINDETPLVNMTIDFANKTLNFTLTYANKTLELSLQYAQKGKNISWEAFNYLKNKTIVLVNRTRELKNDMDFRAVYLVANFTRNVTQWSIDYARDYGRLGVEYVNGTMVGWFIRYYELHYIPYNLYNTTYTHVNRTPEYLRRMVEFNKRLTVDTLNRIGRLEDNSFAINISHPLNITSFRKFPNLTNSQWEVINNVTGRVKIYACKAREYIDLVREIAEEKYTIAKEYVTEIYERERPRINEKINQLKAKYEELKVKVQELRERIPEYRELAMEKYETFKANLPEYKQQLKAKLQEIKEQIPTWEEIKEIPATIKAEIDAMVARWPETYVELRNKIISLPAKYLELKSKINAWIEQLEFDIPMECQKLMDTTVEYPRINTEIVKICNKIPELRLQAEEKYEELQRYIEIAKVYVEKKIELICENRPTECEQIKQYWQTVNEIDAPYVTQKLQEYIPETWDQAKMEAREQWEILRQKIDELKIEAETKIEELKVKVDELKVKAQDMKQDLKEKIIEIRDLIKQEYPNAKEHIKNAITQIKNMVEGTYQAIRTKLIDFIEANYPTLKKYVDEIVREILDRIMRLKPTMDREATAMIFGNLGVFTFDQKLYEFPGYRDPSCTYVLARDFVDRNFTLLSDERALTAVFPSVVVKVNDESKVYINGMPEHTELPYQSPDRNVIVTREGPWVNVTTKYGIKIACHDEHFLCTIKMSSFYHGKTQGLLGTFDREIDNEMRRTDGNNATNIVEWVNNYEVTGHSYCQIPPGRNVFPTRSGVCDEPAAQKISVCESLFMDPESRFSEGFNMISQGPFFEMCNHMARECLDICDVAHGYVSLCREEGVFLKHSPLCDRCENTIQLDTQYNITKIPVNTADIVVVVSERDTVDERGRAKTHINDLISKMDKTLRKANIENNRFSLVAFGGEGVHSGAHQHTSKGKIFATKEEFYYGIQSLEFNGQYQTDAMAALEWANNLHWRPEATRIVILVTEAERMEPYNASLTYQDITAKLDQNSIRLFVFSEYETLNKDGIEPVLGINFDSTLLTTKRTSADDLAKLKLPKGHYAKIATATKGAMFRINMLLDRDIDRNEFNAQISKVLRNSIQGEFDSINYKSCMCSLDKNQCPISECKTIRK